MATKASCKQLDYRIKQLTNCNVVLVECSNYESEMFTPQIVDGQIKMLNIIPNRRCCQISKTNVIEFAKGKSRQTTNSYDKQKLVQCANERLSLSSPLAKSTPAAAKQKHSCATQSRDFCTCLSATDSTLPTPEPVRRAVPDDSMILKKSLINFPKAVKVSRIYHNPVEGTPKKFGRLVMTNSTRRAHHSGHVSLLNASFELPCSPIVSKRSNNEQISNKILNSVSADCIARWQKVLTPVRTYGRKSIKLVAINTPQTAKRKKYTKFVPTYLFNPTQGLKSCQEIEIKKCKLIRDRSTQITPRSFKKQQTQSADAHTIISNIPVHPDFLNFHKSRSYSATMGMSAFDLLTSSNRNRMICRKLNEQFRKGCVNKAASTYTKYKILCTVPPIEQDEQVLELSRILLEEL